MLLCRTVLHGGILPGGPPPEAMASDQLHHEARMAARYDQGDAASSLDAEEAEGEAHGWLIARSDTALFAYQYNGVDIHAAATFLAGL